jgi:hypothetical protein
MYSRHVNTKQGVEENNYKMKIIIISHCIEYWITFWFALLVFDKISSFLSAKIKSHEFEGWQVC